MSVPTQQDFKTVIIHGKNAPKSRDINLVNIHSKADLHRTGGMNASSLERKIDDGKVTVPKTIPLDIANLFRDSRMAIKNAVGNSLSQYDFAKQSCVPKVDAKFISMLEGGSLLLNHDNKTTLRKLQTKMKISHFNLP